MKINKLEWRDNISDNGKKSGLFELLADVIVGNSYLISFTIRNYKSGDGFKISDKLYLWIKKGIFNEECVEFDNIEDAKERAQKEFKDRIVELFFDNEFEKFLDNNSEVKSRGIELFGNLEKLEKWIMSPTMYSKGYLDDGDGRVIDMPVSEILAEIGRIEHGVF